MKLSLLQIGSVPADVLERIRQGLEQTYPNTKCVILDEILALPEEALDKQRKQYNSEVILREIFCYASKYRDFERFLGVVDADIFVPGLNFVFGEAQCPGRAALISLSRLRPEFYGAPADETLFLERAVKEAVHEVGHTLWLRHCPRDSCVMHFSSSIVETDQKKRGFCDRCGAKVASTVGHLNDV